MGGSFNPPHEGHVRVAETALRRLELDRLWWIVSPGNPLKDTQGMQPMEARIAQCRALTTDPRFEVTGFEAALPTPYTARTLAFLHARFPDTRFIWVMGADNLAQFHRWRDWRQIAATTPLAVVDRPNWRLRALASPAARALAPHRVNEERAIELGKSKPPAWTFLSARLSEASSTKLRATRAWKPAKT
jgi:nicotinate-nucleotide adenylyltransferase